MSPDTQGSQGAREFFKGQRALVPLADGGGVRTERAESGSLSCRKYVTFLRWVIQSRQIVFRHILTRDEIPLGRPYSTAGLLMRRFASPSNIRTRS
jgi:hypothetical protein